MATLTSSYKKPNVLQIDGFSCGHRSIAAITSRDTAFDERNGVKTVQSAIVEARQLYDALDTRSTGSNNSVSAEAHAERRNQLALVIAYKLGLLQGEIQSNVAAAYVERGDADAVAWSPESLTVFNTLDDLCPPENAQKLREVFGLAQQLYAKGVEFVNIRDLSPSDASNSKFRLAFGRKGGLQELKLSLTDWMRQDCSAPSAQDEAYRPCLREDKHASRSNYWLQEPDIRAWCYGFTQNKKSDTSSSSDCLASIATRGSDDEPLVEVELAVQKVLTTEGRTRPVELHFVVNDDNTATVRGRGTHWTYLRVTIDQNNNVTVVYTDSMRNSDSGGLLLLAARAIESGFQSAGVTPPTYSREESKEDDSTAESQNTRSPSNRYQRNTGRNTPSTTGTQPNLQPKTSSPSTDQQQKNTEKNTEEKTEENTEEKKQSPAAIATTAALTEWLFSLSPLDNSDDVESESSQPSASQSSPPKLIVEVAGGKDRHFEFKSRDDKRITFTLSKPSKKSSSTTTDVPSTASSSSSTGTSGVALSDDEGPEAEDVVDVAFDIESLQDDYVSATAVEEEGSSGSAGLKDKYAVLIRFVVEFEHKKHLADKSSPSKQFVLNLNCESAHKEKLEKGDWLRKQITSCLVQLTNSSSDANNTCQLSINNGSPTSIEMSSIEMSSGEGENSGSTSKRRDYSQEGSMSDCGIFSPLCGGGRNVDDAPKSQNFSPNNSG